MNVYLVPLAVDRFACYFEAPDDEPADAAAESPGVFGRLRARFNIMLRDAERARHEAPPSPAAGFLGRMQQRTMRWVAERVAEQRLLWHLGQVTSALLHVPADLDAADADRRLRDSLKQDADSHLRRLVLHSGALLLAAPLTVLPGPNVVGYLFTFTVVGHFLAWRGARKGLTHVAWQVRPSDALADLRGAFTLSREDRHRRVHEVADQLHLRKLPTFVERMTRSTA